MKECNASLGGEIVGHIVLSDYAKTGDALITAIILSLAYLNDGRKMSEIFPIFDPTPCVDRKIRFSSTKLMHKTTELHDVKEAINKAKMNITKNGRILIRESGTEPVLKIRVEGENNTLINDIINELANEIIKHQI